MGRLEGKVAIITGAGSGIGKATALLFAREGAHIVAGIYQPEQRASLPEAMLTIRADVSHEEDAALLTRSAMERFGRVDILVNNAGIDLPGLITETKEEIWDRQIDVNLKGAFLCAKHAIPEMLKRGQGAVVNNASINGIRGNHRLVSYSASKGGVVAMTLALALDYADQNIRVNCVCPAAIEGTDMFEASLKREPDPEARRRLLIAKHPMGRLGKPDEVASAILFLASDEASYITGVVLPIDGGRSIR